MDIPSNCLRYGLKFILSRHNWKNEKHLGICSCIDNNKTSTIREENLMEDASFDPSEVVPFIPLKINFLDCICHRFFNFIKTF